MKLNNRGWGIKEMLLLSAVLIFFFGVAIYFIYMLYSSLDLGLNDDSNYIEIRQYEAIEEKIEEDALDYLLNEDYYVNVGDKILLNELIKEGYIDFIYDPNTDGLCEGYVVVKSIENSVVDAFIKCDEYETNGYEE